MIGDGLSHVGFGTMAIAMAFNCAPLAVSIPVCVIAAFLLLQGTETLSLRLERHAENTKKVVDFLASHPQVKKVNHPSLPDTGDRYLSTPLFND